MKKKLTSRKFWMAVAAFLGSIAAMIVGLDSDNEILTVVGIVCSVISAAIYNIIEAVVDVNEDTTEAIEEATEDSSESEIAGCN